LIQSAYVSKNVAFRASGKRTVCLPVRNNTQIALLITQDPGNIGLHRPQSNLSFDNSIQSLFVQVFEGFVDVVECVNNLLDSGGVAMLAWVFDFGSKSPQLVG